MQERSRPGARCGIPPITGSNFGNHPTIYISPPDITYSSPTFKPDGSVSTTVSVPASETATQASVYIVPGNVGCTGNCYTSSDPGKQNKLQSYLRTEIASHVRLATLTPAQVQAANQAAAKAVTK